MRYWMAAILAWAVWVPAVQGAVTQEHATAFAMADGFTDRMTVVSGAVRLENPAVTASTGFFRTSGAQVDGVSKACWQGVGGVPPQCLDGPLTLVIPSDSSFGIHSAGGFPVEVAADHALITFVDLSHADGFNAKLLLGPSALASLVGSTITAGPLPPSTPTQKSTFTTLEEGSTLELRDATGALVHTVQFSDSPLVVDGTPTFRGTFSAKVAVLPIDGDAKVNVVPAKAEAAQEGLSHERLAVLDDVMHKVRFLGPGAKDAPLAILAKAGTIVSEVFNGAFIRTRLADDPHSLGDVAFAKFTDLTIAVGNGGTMDFDGSYTLVVGDLGPSFHGSSVAGGSLPVRWWVGVLIVLGVVMTGAYLWLREGPLPKSAPGPQTLVARVATAVGVVALFLVWDLRLHGVLGSSLLTTGAHGAALGVLVTIELASMVLAGLLIGLPVYLTVRYGLALLRQPRFAALSSTAGVFLTLGLGILILPALVAFLINVAA